MPFALEAVFTAKADDALRAVLKALEDAGLPSAVAAAGGRPHLSLAVATSVEGEQLRATLGAGTRCRPPRALVLASVGSFPGPGGIVFLGAVPTADLLAWHEEVDGMFRPHARDPRPYYAPRSWIPHVTLTYRLDGGQIGRAIEAARACSLPLVAELEGFALTETSPTYVQELWRARFVRRES